MNLNLCQVTTTQKLDDKEKSLLAAEMEVNTLNRKVVIHIPLKFKLKFRIRAVAA